ncbi:MAG: recombinase family protein, partial [Oscillospiraceae bacterium]|nr:recombinase family protein [Oscillospiraceae bacterium]
GEFEDSNSIQNQRTILYDYACKNGYLHPQFFYDDGVSGTTFEREGFKAMEAMVEAGKVSTIIVKDLSRFGRNYLEVGNYLEMIYPSLGVKFIAIQENVDTLAGTGTEMMPFHNIFNEWYAAQTSKKIKAVWAMKAANGKRIGSTVPYGYVKDTMDHEKWYIDKPAAEIVRKIFALCLAGLGPLRIAKQLEAEKILTPTAYFNSIHRPTSNKAPSNPYRWSESTVENILANRQYTGCTVNFMTTSVSYKVHKTVYRPEDECQIIPDTQDAIIDENTWFRVQELRKNKRRPTATGRKSLFSGLVFCPDCGAKLHFCAAKSLRRDQEFFRCANYKDGRRECTIHFIRDVVLEKIVHEAISSLADFVRCYESVFLLMVARQNSAMFQQSMQETKCRLEKSRRRVDEIDRIITRLYEDNIAGKLNDERFAKMSAAYETEQKELELSIAACEQKMREADKAKVDLRMLLKGLREFTERRELTPTIVNTVIQRIEVHNSDRSSGHIRVKVDIYFTAAGMIDIPAEEDVKAIEEEISANPQKYRFSA